MEDDDEVKAIPHMTLWWTKKSCKLQKFKDESIIIIITDPIYHKFLLDFKSISNSDFLKGVGLYIFYSKRGLGGPRPKITVNEKKSDKRMGSISPQPLGPAYAINIKVN